MVRSRFMQHQGELHVAAATVMGLVLWLLHPKTPSRYMQGYASLMQQVEVVNLDQPVAERAAFVGSQLAGQTPRLTPIDLMVVATALERGLTLVTHDGPHYANVPGLLTVDWMVP
jgi:predicted nucleic acid-binding protein